MGRSDYIHVFKNYISIQLNVNTHKSGKLNKKEIGGRVSISFHEHTFCNDCILCEEMLKH
jgi:hypothetical protein